MDNLGEQVYGVSVELYEYLVGAYPGLAGIFNPTMAYDRDGKPFYKFADSTWDGTAFEDYLLNYEDGIDLSLLDLDFDFGITTYTLYKSNQGTGGQ